MKKIKPYGNTEKYKPNKQIRKKKEKKFHKITQQNNEKLLLFLIVMVITSSAYEFYRKRWHNEPQLKHLCLL